MATRTTQNVSLTPHLQRIIDEQLASGRFATASEVIREGLRLVEERDRRLALDELRAKIDLGWQQSERGESRDGEAVFTDLRAKLAARVSASGGKPAGRAKPRAGR